MQQRERLLLKITSVVALIAAAQFGLMFVQGAFEERQTRVDALEQELADKDAIIARGKRAQRRLKEWERRSLPADLDQARSLYQNWLANAVERLRFDKAEVTSGPAMPRLNFYNRLPFTVRGTGSLDQVASLLYEFYKADHLHQIQRLQLTPVSTGFGRPSPFATVGAGFDPRGPLQFDLSLTIEALVLPGADRRDQLNDAVSERLAWKELDEYRIPITQRNLFAPYAERIDEARDAYFTGITRAEGRLQAWLSLRSSGRTLKLNEGDKLDVGSLHGTVARIREQAIEIESDGKRRRVSLGKSLAEGQELPAG
ncbi:MAG TPA: hypothetical protein VMV10_31770 [Pirellulales bacterium]|nr:hypothetical protein [Pirellulales bacterium]